MRRVEAASSKMGKRERSVEKTGKKKGVCMGVNIL